MYRTQSIISKAFIEETERREVVEGIESSLSDSDGRSLDGGECLVDKLIDAPLVGFPALLEEAGEDVEATELVEHFVGSYPDVGLLGSIGQMLEKVEGRLFGNLLRGDLLHPDVYNLGQHLVGRHNHGGKNLALAHILLPEGYGKVVILAIVGSHLLESRQRYSPVEVIVNTLVAHRLCDSAVHL